jgi:hypothetical protein
MTACRSNTGIDPEGERMDCGYSINLSATIDEDDDQRSSYSTDEGPPVSIAVRSSFEDRENSESLAAVETTQSSSQDMDCYSSKGMIVVEATIMCVPATITSSGPQDDADDSSVTSSEASSIVYLDEHVPSIAEKRMTQWTMMLGFLVGEFIQLSSLGANFLLTQWSASTEASRGGPWSSSNIFLASLGWSLLTSFICVLLLALIRHVLQIARMSSVNDGIKHITTPMFMECHFAGGALVGVCAAWAMTDLVLGFTGHLMHSLLTLAGALVWCKFVGYVVGQTPSGQNEDGVQAVVTSKPSALVNDSLQSFRVCGISLGLLIGCFIQWSSLGANFLLTVVYGTSAPSQESGAQYVNLTRHDLVIFSWFWSLFTSTLGVLILVCLRQMVSITASPTSVQGNEIPLPLTKVAETLISILEGWFATGCLVGVNLAWMATEVFFCLGPGLTCHSPTETALRMLYSLLALIGALLWCHCVSWCLAKFEKSKPELDNWEELQEPLLLIA